MEDNNKVYSGLPESIKHKVHWLTDPNDAISYDNSELFTDLVVELQTGDVLGFNKINMPSEYIRHIFEEFFSRHILAIQNPSRQQKLSIVKQYVYRIYCRIYTSDTSHDMPFRKIWLAYRNNRYPWEKIADFHELFLLQRALALGFNHLALEDRAARIGECNYVLKPLEKWQLN